jgi:DNA-binding XRE family transcriptional regulator
MGTKKKIRNNIDQILKWDFNNMSQAEFAARIGENRTHFNKICAGEVEPGVLKAIKIAKELGKTVEEVWY